MQYTYFSTKMDFSGILLFVFFGLLDLSPGMSMSNREGECLCLCQTEKVSVYVYVEQRR